MEPSELLVSAAVAEGITSIATVHDRFYVCRRGLNGSAGSLGSSSYDVLQEVLDWARRDLKEPVRLIQTHSGHSRNWEPLDRRSVKVNRALYTRALAPGVLLAPFGLASSPTDYVGLRRRAPR
jgi:hypothetical protein